MTDSNAYILPSNVKSTSTTRLLLLLLKSSVWVRWLCGVAHSGVKCVQSQFTLRFPRNFLTSSRGSYEEVTDLFRTFDRPREKVTGKSGEPDYYLESDFHIIMVLRYGATVLYWCSSLQVKTMRKYTKLELHGRWKPQLMRQMLTIDRTPRGKNIQFKKFPSPQRCADHRQNLI